MRVPSRQNKLGSDLREQLASLPGWTWEYQFKRSPDRMPRMRLPEWQIGWAALEEYVKETGHAAPPKNFTTTGGVRLGRWALRQRQLYLSGELEREKAEQLWTLPGWVWNVSDAQWERNYAALEAYVLVHGNTYPSSEYETENGQSLASWVATQRKAIKRGTLRQNRRERLEDLPGWDLARPFRARRRTAPISRELPPHYVALWEQGYDELVAYTATHGNPHVPQRYRAETGFTLGHWVSAQRMSYRNGTMKASFPERIQRLESVDGWVWSHFDALWEAGYTQLFEYSRQHETASPGSKFVTDSGYRLGEWVMDQRRKFRSGQLSGQRSERLGALPGWYWEK